jgi:hypothetical protein
VNLKRTVFWVAVALIAFYVVQAPEHAAYVVRNAGSGLVVAGTSFASFVGSLF